MKNSDYSSQTFDLFQKYKTFTNNSNTCIYKDVCCKGPKWNPMGSSLLFYIIYGTQMVLKSEHDIMITKPCLLFTHGRRSYTSDTY